MFLAIDKNYRISADAHSWQIERLTTRKRRGVTVTEFRPILWYSTISGAANGLAELMLRTSDAKTLDEAMTEVNRINAKLCQALKPHFEITDAHIGKNRGLANAGGALRGIPGVK